MPPQIRRRRNELVLRVQRVDDPAAVFAEASTRLRRLVPFDAAVWLTTDPGTGLPTAPTLADNLELEGELEQCSAMWRREFLVEDAILYRDIARAEVPAASLRATVADPNQSARYREFLEPQGFTDELRAVLRVGDSPWGAIDLLRRRGQAAFSQQETELVASLSAPLGEALRSRARPAGLPGGPVPDGRPGLLLSTAAADWSRPTRRPGPGWPSCRLSRTCPATSASGCRCGCWARSSAPWPSPAGAGTGRPAAGSGPAGEPGWSATPPCCATPTTSSPAWRWSSSRPPRPRSPRSSSRPTT
jgi:hypothetical protein